MILYGSCARNDNQKDSDVDIFALCDDMYYNMIIKSKINIAKYPLELAINRAKNGDLFVLHILEEGKVIYDSSQYYQKLKSNFKYKNNYSEEIHKATEVSCYLLSLGSSVENYFLFNKALAWCVRTILIAKSTEQKKPLFSAKELGDFSNLSYVYDLIKSKNESTLKRKNLNNFKSFIQQHGSDDADDLIKKIKKIKNVIDYFQSVNNYYGIKLAKKMSSGNASLNYFD